MPSYRFGPGEPALFVGATRSGKSNLIAWLLQDHSSVVIVDSKWHPDEWASWGPSQGYVVTQDPAEIRRQHKVIYRVSTNVLMDVAGWRRPGTLGYQWTEALEAILRRGNTVVVFDETVHTLPAGRPHPTAMQIYTQGAAWGLRAWAGTQFANRIETATVRSAVHCVCFRLNPYDLRLLAEQRGVSTDPLRELPDYGFGYHLTNTPEWSICQPVELVMSGREASVATTPDRELDLRPRG